MNRKKDIPILSKMNMHDIYFRMVTDIGGNFPAFLIFENQPFEALRYNMQNGNDILYFNNSEDIVDRIIEEIKNPNIEKEIAPEFMIHSLDNEDVSLMYTVAVILSDILKIPCPQVEFRDNLAGKYGYSIGEINVINLQTYPKEYSAVMIRAMAAEMDKHMTEADKAALVDTIIVKTQGFVNGNISEKDNNPVELFRNLLSLYDGITPDKLRENMKYFLEQIMPVCEEWNMNMCVHPDDPPMQLLGLPRIVTCDEDIEWFLSAVDNPHNGLTFCCGSLSAGAQNDIPALARKYAKRTHFVHLRSTDVLPNGDFIEADHLHGRANLIEVCRIFEEQNPNVPMRVDHGRTMLGDEDKGYNAGYSFHGRMMGLAQMDGVMATVKYLKNKS